MLDNASGNPPGTDPGTRGQGTEGDDSITAVIGATSDHGSDGIRDDRGLVNVGFESSPAATRSRSTGCSRSTPATASCTSPTRWR